MRRGGTAGPSVRHRLTAARAAARPRGAFGIEALERRTLLSYDIIADLNVFTNNASPSEPLTVGGLTYFFADDGETGRELWRTDGTTAGTVMVKDIGRFGGGAIDSWVPDGERLVNVGNTVYFLADDGAFEHGLWKTDGTDAGTVPVPAVGALAFPTTLRDRVALGDRLIFVMESSGQGSELWVSDGTDARVVKDINPGEGDSSIGDLVVWGDRVAFTADDGSGVFQIWTTDGTEAGTVPFTEFDGTVHPEGDELVVFNDELYFTGRDAVHGPELWKSDGTHAGTALVAELRPGDWGPSPQGFEIAGGLLYFGGFGSEGTGVFRTDGTPWGTFRIGLNHPNDLLEGREFTSFNGSTYFLGYDYYNSFGYDLWRTDGVNTELVKELPAWSSAGDHEMVEFGGKLYMTTARDIDASFNPVGSAIWSSDGTPEGTGPFVSSPTFFPRAPLAVAGDVLLFTASDGEAGHEFWRTDGTPQNTALLKDINTTTRDGAGHVLGQLGRTTFFSASTTYSVHDIGIGAGPFRLWKTNGIRGNASLIDVPGLTVNSDHAGVVYNGFLYFGGTDSRGANLWRTDGTVAGTTIVKDGVPNANWDPSWSQMFVHDNRLYGMAGSTLWRSDGTAAGTVPVLNAGDNFPDVEVVGGAIYIGAEVNSTAGRELYRIDAANPSGVLVKDVRPGAAGSNPLWLTAVGTTLYFRADDGTGQRIWRTDGTAGGTVPAPNVTAAGITISNFGNMSALGTSLVFGADSSAGGHHLFRYDGAQATQLTPAGPGRLTSEARTVVGGRVLFGGSDGKLWSTDGTPAGTGRLGDVRLVPAGVRDVDTFAPFKGKAYFAGDGNNAGVELWVTDGTAGGTKLLTAVNFSIGHSNPKPGFGLTRTMYFVANDEEFGTELFILDDTAPVVKSFTPPSPVAGTASTLFSVTYDDDVALREGWVNTNDVLASWGAGNEQIPQIVSVTNHPDGSVTGTYRLAAPGGTWDVADHGTYAFDVRANSVIDVYGNYAAAGRLGTVTVDFSTPQPVTLRAAADAYVRDGTSATTNFGTAADLVVKKASTAGSNRETYLRFDLSGVPSVGSAKLRLFGRLGDASTAGVTTTVYDAANATWSEGGLTWDTRPAAGTASRGTVTVAGTTSQWYELDLTNFLKAEKAAGRNLVTLVLKSGVATSAQTIFASDEAAANRPELVVTPAGPPPQGLVVSAPGVTVPEGGSANFTVKLAVQPAADVVVNVARAGGGDADLSTATTSLTFTAANWNVAQTVTVNAAEDADATNGTASFAVSSAGLPDRAVAATEADNDTPPPPATRRASRDAYVRGGSTYGGTNFGTSAELVVRKASTTGSTRETYLHFSISDLVAGDLDTVKLRLFGRSGSATQAVPVAVHGGGTASWTEGGLTYNNRPAGEAAVLASGTVSGTANAWREFDVTAYVKARREAGATGVTFVVKGTATTDAQATFASDEHATSASRPQLAVTTKPAGPPPQGLVVSATNLSVPEGGSANFTVKLAAQPASDVTVTVAKAGGGDGDLTAAATTLTFTSGNWDAAQTVTVNAAEDADAGNGTASFTVSSTGLTSKSVAATESDNDAPAAPVTLRAAADAYVRDGTSSATNFGTAAELVVKRAATAGSTREGYLRFDLSGGPATIGSAKLRLNGRLGDTSSASLATEVFGATNAAWTETGLTWDTRPAPGASALGTITVSGTTAAWYELDLTAFLAAERAAGRNLVTLVLRNPAASSAQTIFASDEAAGGRPELVVG
jgi:ELWxxDGT repeat protein